MEPIQALSREIRAIKPETADVILLCPEAAEDNVEKILLGAAVNLKAVGKILLIENDKRGVIAAAA